MRHTAILLIALFALATGRAQPEGMPPPDDSEAEMPAEGYPLYKFRVYLRDKKGTAYSVRHPEEFLSQKAIDRRRRQGLKVDRTDLPLSAPYVEAIRETGVEVCHGSKWNNTLLVQTSDTALVEGIREMPFVTSVRLVATYARPQRPDTTDRHALIATEEPVRPSSATTTVNRLFDRLSAADSTEGWIDSLAVAKAVLSRALAEPLPTPHEAPAYEDSLYGAGHEQIAQLGGLALHEAGYRGAGMTIAIVDGGFYNADIIPMLQGAHILGTADFVEPGGDVYTAASHGMMVLSCIAANAPGQLIGTAPEAAFWLLRSEDTHSEQLVEEDNWAAAVEFADSVGADIINSSLGYTKFDAPAATSLYRELDGHTHLSSHSASLLARKGIVLCNSAGNAGDEPWKLIGSPADATDILTVGAVDNQGLNTYFSSVGPTADGRIKPDVMARGGRSAVLSIRGNVTRANGTSFASPTLCGLVACYWQANPTLSALQVVENIRLLGDNAQHPDNIFGWGIPDFSQWNSTDH